MTAYSGSKAMGSLRNLLLDFVDTEHVQDSNYEIAQTLIRHYDELPSMSLRKMADLCFVSQASFSRFCRFLGFDSFAEFKEALDGVGYFPLDDYTKEFCSQLVRDDRAALASYRSQVLSLLGRTLDEDNLAAVPGVLDAIDAARRVMFFSHHFLWHVGRYFQDKMLQLGKYVELYQSYERQEEASRLLDEDDVAIVCSLNGSYFSHYRDVALSIYSSGAKVVVITQNRHALFINRADHVLMCGDSNENDIGKYAALMTMDYLAMAYLRHIELRRESAPSDCARD